MAFDAYASCPCGSGKKFKWCCQPIHQQIDRAFEQDAQGQHDAALRLMEEVVAQHPTNPEVFGRKALLLYRHGKVEEAEKTLERAFQLNPNYAFGYLLQGTFRQQEGELLGALRLFRKAADAYDTEALDPLAEVYGMIGELEMGLNRPVAARAALRISLHCQPNQPEIREYVDAIFGPESPMPASARQDYQFQSPASTLSGERRQVWDRALQTTGAPRLSQLVQTFEQLTEQDPQDAAAWLNLAIARAWLGNNAGALEALERYVALEPDEGRAAGAWSLGEVLRCAHGMEAQADYVEHAYYYQLRDPERMNAFLQEWSQSRKLIGVSVDEEQGMLRGLIPETGPILAGAPSIGQMARLGAYLFIMRGLLQLRHTNKETLERARQEVQQFFGPTLSEPQSSTRHASFGDVFMEAMSFPLTPFSTQEEADRRIADEAGKFYEASWLNRPLRSLSGQTPMDAAGHASQRKKLRGVVQFLQECAAGTALKVYDFDRLRQQLGLMGAKAAAPDAAAAPEIGAMNAADLGGLAVDALTDDQLNLAWQTAQKVDAQELADHFARSLAARPVRPEQPDRFPWYSYLVQRSLGQGDTESALNFVNEGDRIDREANDGGRQNDYEQRRAQIHAKRGEADLAHDAFVRLIERAPAELRYRGSAAEAMLSMRQGARALRFAEEGLAKARQQNNRDLEQYFLELSAAAKKQA